MTPTLGSSLVRKIFAIALVIGVMAFVKAQTSLSPNAAEIKIGLNKLNVLGSVLYIAAHPDDENTRLLAWLAREKMYRTGYLSLTRGDGGQNLIGSEQGEQLGLIRTQELLAARRVDGAEQFFTRANDFGFSKTAEETLRIWNRDHILADVVWTIRKFRPDVIITRFTDDARAGHGHHQSSSILAQLAYTAAADPAMFPEQLRYVKVWQARCILLNGANFGGVNTAENASLKIDISEFNALLGKGYGEIAAESRSNHKSQGFGSARQRGPASESFSLWKGTMPKSSLLEGVETTWKRVPRAEKVQLSLDKIIREYDMEAPEKSVAPLVSLLGEVEALQDDYWKDLKSQEIRDLIVSCAGLWFESYADAPSIAVTDPITVTNQIVKRTAVDVKLIGLTPNASDGQTPLALAKNQPINLSVRLQPTELTQPYFLVKPHPIGEYTVDDPLLIGNAENPSPPNVRYVFNIAGKNISYTRPVVYKFTDQVKGEIYRPLTIVPPVAISPLNQVVLASDNLPRSWSATLTNYTASANGTLTVEVPAGWIAEPVSIPFSLAKKGAQQVVRISIRSTAAAVSGKLKATVTVNGHAYSQDLKTIQYDHIPTITYFPQAETKLVKLDLKMAGKKIGYIPGAGDLVPDMLRQIGYNVTTLSGDEADFSSYDAIITGVRAYNVNPAMAINQPRLLRYVEQGGTLLIQYNVNRPLVMDQIGPYPFTVGAERVTEEDAPVTLLKPEHPVLVYPNKITPADFNGWIQERGIYFATAADPRYQAVLSMGDTGAKPSDGSLLVANYGKGRFVYTSLVFFRELPAGVPGAYRLFVNLISNKK